MEEDYNFMPYKDISQLKKDLDSMRGKKDISTKELYDSIQKLAQTMNDIIDVFGAAAEQMKLEDKEYESDAKKHEIILSKIDKLMDQNKTIAEGMVAIVDAMKKTTQQKEPDSIFRQERQQTEPNPFMRYNSSQQYNGGQQQMPSMNPMSMGSMNQISPPINPPASFNPQISMGSMNPQPMPSMQPILSQTMGSDFTPPPFNSQPSFTQTPQPPMPPQMDSMLSDLDLDKELGDEEPKKKGIFGLFKK